MTRGPILAFLCSFSLSVLLEPEYLPYKELHSPRSVVSEAGFYQISKEATSLVCLSHGIDRVLFTQNIVPSEVSVSMVLEHMDMEVACDKESERRVQNTDCSLPN